jgi:hypothetical protein
MLTYKLNKLPLLLVLLIFSLTLFTPLTVYAQSSDDFDALGRDLANAQANEESGEGEEQGEATSPQTGGTPAPVLDASANPATRNLKQECLDRQNQRFRNDTEQSRERFKSALNRAIDNRVEKLRELHRKVDNLRSLTAEEKAGIKNLFEKTLEL